MQQLCEQEQYKILVVDDEREVLESFRLTLLSGGLSNVVICHDSREVLPLLEKDKEINLVLLDLIMPYMGGQDLLQSIRETYPEVAVIVITALDELSTAVDCMKAGAFDYLVKPVEKVRLLSCVRHAYEHQAVLLENRALKQRVLSASAKHPEAFSGVVTRSPAMLSLFQYAEAIAASPEAVLITGETGVGKELFARAIHDLSCRQGRFVAVNVAGLDEQSFSDTLFGHRKGAFTGADSNRDGLLKTAEGGTLFLDEIGDLTPALQVKLLRLLQEREYYPLGSDLPRKAQVRVLVATHRDLSDDKTGPAFRRDLYYRLQTHLVHIPPLRQRKEDLPLLVGHFLDMAAESMGRKAPKAPKELVSLLQSYAFPGNVRELKTMLFDAVSKHQGGVLSLSSLKERIFSAEHGAAQVQDEDQGGNFFCHVDSLPTLQESRMQLIDEALRRAGGNQSIAARYLGITQPALSRHLKRHKEV
ncbi:sigma-54-dependent transcriptional regulator [Desulfocurvus sp. DL9XJH121]